jgi:CheY-like chemotaxis protein
MAIIFADDDEFIRDIAEAMLSNLSDDVFIAEDGKEAINLLNSNGGSVKLVIMDLNMPNMDGFQAVAHIRSKGNKVKCLGFSAGNLRLNRR